MILEVQNGCFGYPKQPVILENINLKKMHISFQTVTLTSAYYVYQYDTNPKGTI